ncbi:RNA methyltransferase [bacterium]|nr:RNA methyltransferase [bacterium]
MSEKETKTETETEILRIASRLAVCLVEPIQPGNIGSVARAMKNMGMSRLVLVRPPDLDAPEARMMSVGAIDILRSATIADTVREAVAPFQIVVSTTARVGQKRPADFTPRSFAAHVAPLLSAGEEAVVVFGREDKGLTTREIDLAPRIINIPASPEYPSLNIAQAVLIVGYEVYCALAGEAAERVPERKLVDADQIERLFEQVRPLLLEIGFLDPSNPEFILSALRKIAGRAGLNWREAKILRGICSDMEWYLNHVAEKGERDGSREVDGGRGPSDHARRPDVAD